ncbi:MAG: gamma-glutamyl-gamma-aminobutyrate hydrolase family protein [Clostridiales bacterium]|nr:gamma-glutamyl-gamma-aminobutyrate hydrolase family protein [Clostridiales bacterium]
MKKPSIAIIPLPDIERKSYWMLPGYMNGLIEAGALPVMLPLTTHTSLLTQIADEYDGFLFTGGHDIQPEMYGQTPLPACAQRCPRRDEMENLLLPMILERDKPLFGICRGLQFLNVALGGTLYQDLPTQRPSHTAHRQTPPYDRPAHSVTILPDTPLHALLGQQEIPVNSCHHQAVRALSPRLSPMALSQDGLVEAVWMPEKKYVWATQWHPEFSHLVDENSRKLFRSFVMAAGEEASAPVPSTGN